MVDNISGSETPTFGETVENLNGGYERLSESESTAGQDQTEPVTFSSGSQHDPSPSSDGVQNSPHSLPPPPPQQSENNTVDSSETISTQGETANGVENSLTTGKLAAAAVQQEQKLKELGFGEDNPSPYYSLGHEFESEAAQPERSEEPHDNKFDSHVENPTIREEEQQQRWSPLDSSAQFDQVGFGGVEKQLDGRYDLCPTTTCRETPVDMTSHTSEASDGDRSGTAAGLVDELAQNYANQMMTMYFPDGEGENQAGTADFHHHHQSPSLKNDLKTSELGSDIPISGASLIKDELVSQSEYYGAGATGSFSDFENSNGLPLDLHLSASHDNSSQQQLKRPIEVKTEPKAEVPLPQAKSAGAATVGTTPPVSSHRHQRDPNDPVLQHIMEAIEIVVEKATSGRLDFALERLWTVNRIQAKQAAQAAQAAAAHAAQQQQLAAAAAAQRQHQQQLEQASPLWPYSHSTQMPQLFPTAENNQRGVGLSGTSHFGGSAQSRSSMHGGQHGGAASVQQQMLLGGHHLGHQAESATQAQQAAFQQFWNSAVSNNPLMVGSQFSPYFQSVSSAMSQQQQHNYPSPGTGASRSHHGSPHTPTFAQAGGGNSGSVGNNSSVAAQQQQWYDQQIAQGANSGSPYYPQN